MIGKKAIWLILSAVLLLAQPGYAWKMFSADVPDTGLLSNSFVDILYNDGIIWMASGNGLNYSDDLGKTWYTRTTETNPGLSSDEPSALFGRPGQIWVAGSHFELFEGFTYPFGDGISLSVDSGLSWETFSPPEASDFARLVYDISGTDSSTYAACFHGGMIVRHDPDTEWKHLFYSPADSLNWDPVNHWASLPSGRYYSCAIDTTHADTLVFYGGSAKGIHKFLYIPKRVKLGGAMIFDIVPAGDLVYFAHEGGVTQADTTTLEKNYTADTSNGLGANWIRKMTMLGGKLWAAVFDPDDTTGNTGLGLYYLDNPESEWTEIGENLSGPPDLWAKADTNLFEGVGGGVFDFNTDSDSTQPVFYIAAGDSGVFRSLDSGQTWNRFLVDSLNPDPASPINQVYSIDVTSDSIFLGTKAGLVIASYIPPFTIDYDTLVTFPEHDSSGSFVSLVRHQDDDSASFTYVGLEPQTEAGVYATYFLDPHIDAVDPDSIPPMRHTLMLLETRLHDLDFILLPELLTIMSADAGLFSHINIPNAGFIRKYEVVDFSSGLTLNSFNFLSAAFVGERLFTGSSRGYGYALASNDWRIFVTNTDPKSHDLAVAITHSSAILPEDKLPGDWIVALEVQSYDTGAVLWAACRRVPDTSDQINALGFSRDYGDTWQEVLPNEQVWNLAFDNNDVVYAAASGGLFAAAPPWIDWERLPIIDPITQDTIVDETEIYSVEVAEDIILVGTELGLAIRNIDPDSSWSITRIFKSTSSDDKVFAAPVPFSPISNNGRLSIHYHVDESAEVTVEIYDFAMNLVRVVAENSSRTGGSDYFETWDGFNGRGDMVAVGIYYIKVTYSTGDIQWGRLAIIP